MNDCWRILPEDIINEIILYVPGHQNIYKVSLCCKKFSKVLSLSLYKKFLEVFAKRFHHNVTKYVFDNENSTYLPIIFQDLSDKLNFNLLLCGIRQMKKLEKLEIHSYTSFAQKDILKNIWLKRGNNLNKLYLQKSKTQNEIILKQKEGKIELENLKVYVLICVLPLLSIIIEKYFNISSGKTIVLLLLYGIGIKYTLRLVTELKENIASFATIT